ncbi:MAG TPA: hypothetical protein DCW90_15030 [Lachnospiraceae bacterium]|nr:Ig-like domain-containing protein [uncultured Lachnoclostridium sp.]HAU86749.1 hypothetical protein [Lachnospiraceae bacterium]
MRKKGWLVVMNVLYYLTLIALIAMMILPHTTIFYNRRLFDPFDKKVNTKTVYLTVGEQYKIKLFTINKRAHYYSSDIKVADVAGTGVVTAFHPGKTIVSIKQKKETYKYRIYVVKLNKKRTVVRRSFLRKLSVKGVNSGVRWKSHDPEIASVNRFGWVKGKRRGKTYIIATVHGKKLKCVVRVK